MKRDVIGFRASRELRKLIEQYGAGYGDLSNAAQALILIGAATLGADLDELHSDMVRLLVSGRLARPARQQIRKMLNIPLNDLLTLSEAAPPPEALEVDPFANIGIEV